MWEAVDGISTSHPPQPQQSDYDENLFKEVEAFEGEEEDDNVMEEIDHYQSHERDLPA